MIRRRQLLPALSALCTSALVLPLVITASPPLATAGAATPTHHVTAASHHVTTSARLVSASSTASTPSLVPNPAAVAFNAQSAATPSTRAAALHPAASAPGISSAKYGTPTPGTPYVDPSRVSATSATSTSTRTSTAPATHAASPTCVNNDCPPTTDPTLVDNGGALVTTPKVYFVQIQPVSGVPTQTGYVSQVQSPTEPNGAGAVNTVLNSPYGKWWQNEDSRPSTNTMLGSGTYAGTITINASISNQALVDDSAIQSALETAVSNNVLPAWDSNTIFVLFFRQGQVITVTNGVTVIRSDQQFCGYHDGLIYSSPGQPNIDLNYIVMPYEANFSGCYFTGPSASAFDNMTPVLAHELAETQTDPSYPRAWITANGNEIADMCEVGNTVAGPVVSPTGYTYSLQFLYERFADICLASKLPSMVSAALTTTAGTDTVAVRLTDGINPIDQGSIDLMNASGTVATQSTDLSGRTTFSAPDASGPYSVFWAGNVQYSGASAVAGTLAGAPTISTITPGTTSDLVSWTAGTAGSSATTTYTATAGNGELISGRTTVSSCTATAPATSCTISNLPTGASYIFNVLATNASGQSSLSADVTAWPISAPPAPTVTSLTPGQGSIVVNWSTWGSGSQPFTGFTASASGVTSGVPGNCTAGASATTCTITGLTGATTYNVVVTAANSVGTGPASVPMQTTTQLPPSPPSAPTNVSATPIAEPNGAWIAVSWGLPASDGGSPIDGYNVTATPQGAGNSGTCGSVTILNCTIQGLSPNTTYTIAVTATNNTATSGAATVIVLTPTTPGAASGLVAVPTPVNSAAVSWNAPAFNGRTPITSYLADAVATPPIIQAPDQCTTAGLSCTIPNLTPGLTYTISLTPTNGVGNGPAITTTVTIPTTPNAPTIQTAVASVAHIAVTWTAPTPNGSPITGYTVTGVSGGNHSTCTTTGLACTLSGLAPGSTYTVYVTADNAGGPSAQSASLQATTPGVPSPVGNLNLGAHPSSITVSWSTPASNGGTPITGYTAIASGAGSSGSCSTTSNSCTIGGLESLLGYTVTVTAANAAGVSGPVSGTVTTSPATPFDGRGYWLVASDGGIFNYGDAGFYGSTGAIHLNKPIVGLANTPGGGGYWLVASDGGIFGFGNAGFYGSTGAITLNKPIVGMASTPSGRGYWLVASDGGIFSFGDAAFYGSTGAITLNKPIVGMASTPSGHGYWLVASDGGIFGFGDAGFHGSAGGIVLNKPIVGMAPTSDGGGYWLVASDGGIFGYGNAGFHGSAGGIVLNKPIVGMTATPDGGGYWMVASDGGIFNYGDAGFYGSAGGLALSRPIVGMA